MSNADIDYIESELAKVSEPPNKHWPPTPVTPHLWNVYTRLESLRTTTPQSGTPRMPWYTTAASGYSAVWDQIVAAGMPTAGGMMGPLDSSVVQHVGVSGQWLLIPNSYTNVQIQQWAVPCEQTGKVAGYVIWDEPDSSAVTIAAVLARKAFVQSIMPGAQTAVTGYDPTTLAALIKAGCADLYLSDYYPSRAGDWSFNVLDQIVAVFEGAGVPYGIVLDAFQAASYPMPTPAQLQAEIDYALRTKAQLLPIYAWQQALEADPAVLAVLKQYATAP